MSVFEDIKAGLVEAVAIAKGEADPVTYKVHVPAEIDVAGIRRGLGLTQAAFARAFGFPIGTVREWEQGRSKPETSARAFLIVIAHEPEAVRRAFARNAEMIEVQTLAIEQMRGGKFRTHHNGRNTTAEDIARNERGNEELERANEMLKSQAMPGLPTALRTGR